MSFYSDASLVFIPSGYKASKAYSAKPTDGTGDLTFTRSNDTATRVGPDGLIEKVRTNLLLQSEALNTTWTDFGTGTTVTPNATTAPDGTLTADLVNFPTAAGATQYVLAQNLTLSIGVPHTISFYAKAVMGTITNLVVRINGSEVSLGETITTTWQRFSKVVIPVTATDDSGFKNRPAVSGSGAAIDVYIWGVQIETGDIATDYIATTTAAVSVGPVANVPRLDYLGSSCPRLLLEPQRTNLVTYSEQFNNAAWTKSDVTVTANNTTSPAGFTDADLITLNAGTSVKQFFQSFSAVTGTYAYSIFAKAGTHRFIQLLAGPSAICNFDLQLGTFNATLATGSIENYGNGWFKCNMVATYTAITAVNLLGVDSLTSVRAEATSSTGNFYIYGAQFEEGAYATSYVPTLGAAVTRGEDNTLTTGLSAVLPQTAGTLFWEIDYTLGSTSTMLMHNTGVSDYAFLQIGLSGTAEGGIYESGVMVDRLAYLGLTSGTYKMAFAYETNSFALYINGVLRDSGTSGSTASISMNTISLDWNSSDFTGVKQVLLFPTRLSNSDLAALTA